MRSAVFLYAKLHVNITSDDEPAVKVHSGPSISCFGSELERTKQGSILIESISKKGVKIEIKLDSSRIYCECRNKHLLFHNAMFFSSKKNLLRALQIKDMRSRPVTL